MRPMSEIGPRDQAWAWDGKGLVPVPAPENADRDLWCGKAIHQTPDKLHKL